MPLPAKPYPWKCATCRERAVVEATIPYTADLEHDGRTYSIELPAITVLRCENCQTVILGDHSNRLLTEALRKKAGLLSPEEIRQSREALGLTQKQLADLLDLSESTISRWESGVQIQQRVMNKLLRAFFEVPDLRRFLGMPATHAPGNAPSSASVAPDEEIQLRPGDMLKMVRIEDRLIPCLVQSPKGKKRSQKVKKKPKKR